MNLFRRIFTQPEKEPTPMAETPPSPQPEQTTPSGETLVIKTDIIDTPVSASSVYFQSVADGATRPLPQDPTATTDSSEHLIFGQVSDIGMARSNNQDAAFSFFATSRSAEERPDFGVFIVADGMGGHHDGEKASAITTRTVARQIINTIYLPMLVGETAEAPITEMLIEAVQKANEEVLKHVPDGGTTLTAVTVIGNLAYIAHVGDSRVYLVNNNLIEQITRDHSLVQRLKELGQITDDEMLDHPQRNVLYRALGQGESLEVDTLTRRLPARSKLLLCSDGLWNQVEEREILDIIVKHSSPQEACGKLVELANARGGFDNISAIVLQITG